MTTTRLSVKRKKLEEESSAKEDLEDTIEDILCGDFFKFDEIRLKGTSAYYKKLHYSLQRVKTFFQNSIPSIIDVADGDYSLEKKQKIIESLYALNIAEIGSSEYYYNLRYLQSVKNPELNSNPIANVNTSQTNKKIIERMHKNSTGSDSESEKYRLWVDNAMSVPFGLYTESSNTIECVRSILDSDLAFMSKPKDRIINLLVKSQRNPSAPIKPILIHGPKGTGKTSIAKSIAKALNKPFKMLPLAGESDVSVLNGHNFTYTGAIPGRITSILAESKCMNPVVLIDELDKISTSKNGNDITGALIHMTDITSNNTYSGDRYYNGMEFDLSKVIFIFTANNIENISPILLDRLFKIEVENYNSVEEFYILKNYILPKIMLENDCLSLSFSDESLRKIISCTKINSGLRDVEEAVDLIVSRVSTLITCGDIVELEYKKLKGYYKGGSVEVLPEHIDTFLFDYIVKPKELSMYM